jgi:hypothetical protein
LPQGDGKLIVKKFGGFHREIFREAGLEVPKIAIVDPGNFA